ncbi:hypothetical protein ACF06Q_20040 [Streptomyces leeuwenhoekii]|uniref:hypothetical protein n=1 Tax=Streptomyces leeuwenhoekii TaxID=1437453 RepID=UPI003701F9C4
MTKSELNATFTYLGPIPQEKDGTMLATNPALKVGGGTASRACQTSNLCTYYNFMMSGEIPIDIL